MYPSMTKMIMLSHKISFTTAFFIIALLFSVSLPITSNAELGVEEVEVEVEALKAFKNSITHDPNGAIKDWINTSHHCNWSGIACDKSSHVISISLVSQKLQGKISPFLGNISRLQVFDLTSNSFSGFIPPQLSLCSQLSQLILVDNSLSGSVPPELGNLKNLQYLDLGSNNLTGSLPDSIFNITSLLGIAFNFNNLSGGIPPNIGNLVNVIQIAAFGNQFVGSIPHSVGNLSALQSLDFSQNNLSGEIPREIGNLSNLQYLVLFENSLVGKISSELGRCKNLMHLELYRNQFSGSIPSELGNLVQLQTLRLFQNNLNSSVPSSIFKLKSLTDLGLSQNQLEGTIPSEIGSLGSLQKLNLRLNMFSGEIPDGLFNCSNLTTLGLEANNFSGVLKPAVQNLLNLQVFHLGLNSFTGPIPPEIGNLSQLVIFSIQGNMFSGHIPQELSKLTHLQGLYLADNALEGTIPNQLSELKQLTGLLLHNNKLVGQIPESFSNLEMLSYLSLHGNNLNGTIPRELGRLTRLLALDLSQNHLTGSIPGDVIAHFSGMQMYLNLSHNHFVGAIPDEIGKLEMIQAINVSNNNLSGVIPMSLSGCRNLFNLDFSGNNFSGPIPTKAFSNMDLLQSLNLSRNHLDGEIPEVFSKLDHLSSLDLSQNSLKGTIPKSLANLSNLKLLNLSFNQLEGQVPSGGIFSHLNASELMGNPSLCGTKFLNPCRETTTKSHSLSKKSIYIIAALGSLAVLLFLVFVILFLFRATKFRGSNQIENPEPDYTSALALERFERKDLESATGFFSSDNIIGSSSLSTVYKGELENGKTVAVKKLNLSLFSAESEKLFKREISTLRQLRHRNLVKVLGYAWESGKIKALVLEYMKNGNLDSIIHDEGMDQTRWTLCERLNVLISVANGLDYLHSGYDFPIVHCDLKPSNILLDAEWEAHVSDFGTARMLGLHLQDAASSLSSSTVFEGTIGYLPPEVAYMRKVTTKVDVFSFGIIVMEFLTRRRPTGVIEEDGLPLSLRELVQKAVVGGTMQHVVGIVDPMLACNIVSEEEEEDHRQVLVELLKLSLCCTLNDPEERPSMNEVVSLLMMLKTSRKIRQSKV